MLRCYTQGSFCSEDLPNCSDIEENQKLGIYFLSMQECETTLQVGCVLNQVLSPWPEMEVVLSTAKWLSWDFPALCKGG